MAMSVKYRTATMRRMMDAAFTYLYVGRDSSVGIATRYGLDNPGIEFRCARDCSHPSRPALGPTQPSMQWLTGLFGGSKAAGARR
jgi:hypothetical protein